MAHITFKPIHILENACCGDLNGKQGSCMTPIMTTIPEKKCVTWKLKFTLVFYFNNVLQDLLVGRKASGAFRVVLGVCSLGWRGWALPGKQGMQPGMQGMQTGMQPGMQPGMQGMQLGMQPGMQGEQQGMQPGMLYASFASKQGCAHLNIRVRSFK